MAKSMLRRKSIAEARDSLAALVKEVEAGPRIEITRRGRTVAILVSAVEYERLSARRPSPWEAVRDFREAVVREGIDLDDDDFEGLRDPSPGRDVDLR